MQRAVEQGKQSVNEERERVEENAADALAREMILDEESEEAKTKKKRKGKRKGKKS